MIASLGVGGINTVLLACNSFICSDGDGNGYIAMNSDKQEMIFAKKNDSTVSAQTFINPEQIITPTLSQTSVENEKKNFEKLENGLEIVKATDIYKYNLKSQEDTDKKHIGFVIGENFNYASEITAERDGQEIGVDTYSMISVAYKAIQEQQEEIEKLREENKNKEDTISKLIERIEKLEQEVFNGQN